MRKDDSLILESWFKEFDFGITMEEGMIVTRYKDGLRFAVAEEQAVDSYNTSFTCKATLSREQCVELRDYLNEVMA